MRFDMYTGEFEIYMKDGMFNLSKNEQIDKVVYMNKIFRLMELKDRKGEKHLRWIKDNNLNLRNEEDLVRFFKNVNGEE